MRIGVECTNQEELDAVSKYFNRDTHKYGFSRNGSFTIVYNENNEFLGQSSTRFYEEEALSPNSEYKLAKEVSFQEWKQLTNQSNKVQSMKYVVEVNNQQEADAVYSVVSPKSQQKHTIYPKVITSEGLHGSITYHAKPEVTEQYGPSISFKTWAAMFGVKLKPNKTLKLTDDYSAVVNYSAKTIQVGCQTITFAKVEELAKLIKE